jgi:hypothetical protein
MRTGGCCRADVIRARHGADWTGRGAGPGSAARGRARRNVPARPSR